MGVTVVADDVEGVGEDVLDGAIAAVGGERPAAGGLEALGAVALLQPDHRLGLAEQVEGMGRPAQQLIDQLHHGRAQLGGAMSAPGRGAQQEGDLGLRVVGGVDVAALATAEQMGLDQLAAVIDARHPLADADVELLADMPMRRREEAAANLELAIGMQLGLGPVGDLEGRLGQRPHRRPLHALEDLEHRSRQGAMRACPGDTTAPLARSLAHLHLAAEVAAPPVAVPDVGDRALHPRLVLRPARPAGVDEHAVVLRHLRIRPVQLGVVQVGPQHSRLQVVDPEHRRHRPEELEGGDVRCHPGPLVTDEDGIHEHVTAERQRHQEAVHHPAALGQRIEPRTETPVVDLRHLPGRRHLLADRELVGAGTARDPLSHVAPEGANAHPQALLVVQPLPHRLRCVGGQTGHDRLVEPRQLLALLRRRRRQPVDEQEGDPRLPLLPGQQRLPRRQPRRRRRSDDRPHPVAAHAQAARQMPH